MRYTRDMYIAILGRQPELSLAELERLFGGVDTISPQAALFDTSSTVDIQQLGGSQKIGRLIGELPLRDWRSTSMSLVRQIEKLWSSKSGKLTLGISAYGFDVDVRDIQKTGLILKSKLKSADRSVRLVPNQTPELSTATAHHNKLGLSENKIELLVIRGTNGIYIAESLGSQNITALAARDQNRPKRDAFVGMLPPKLALMMINMAGLPPEHGHNPRLLDPFCGTGVTLQEALIRGYSVYGTDLSDKMIDYSRQNLDWLTSQFNVEHKDYKLETGDAMTHRWQSPVDLVVAEGYLGQPFSAPPSPKKLQEVRDNCQHIISQFLVNLRSQIDAGTPVVLAVPAWRDAQGGFTHLPLSGSVSQYGYKNVGVRATNRSRLLYYRPDQIVARELLILKAE